MELYILRHPRVAIDKGICYGQLDVPLGAKWIEEAASFAARLPEKGFDRVYSSPSSRCRQLADYLHPGQVQVDARLQEVNFGHWEGRKWEEIPSEELDPWMQHFVQERPPGGESLADLYARVQRFMGELRQAADARTLLVGHAGVIRCIWAYLLEIPLQHVFKLPAEHDTILQVQLAKNPAWDSIRSFTSEKLSS
ncbi:phosphoglycerate mutase [Nitritalea halalkaliphila LW7]|uniref:Alpha-ribazole phosphatase n=1 Tax=Nitritalea halalkaliphila LW7 TaxID=1189621 RepID=I5CA94_9BACT|nr:alpha-ribazole phosphatase [Nitritalea halalkaliphila]EIM78746.1 phosphoglycerate mutase [Nitritalea halalkaliphila LW7]